jgi:hypothetical protein
MKIEKENLDEAIYRVETQQSGRVNQAKTHPISPLQLNCLPSLMASSRTNHGESDVNSAVPDGDKSTTPIVSNLTPFFMMNQRQILQIRF